QKLVAQRSAEFAHTDEKYRNHTKLLLYIHRSLYIHTFSFELTSSRRSAPCGRFGCAERRA
ncbi:MAG TPA: hypothetical protein H9663_05855, partial [Firmicutes bacterium]|nr:hypothetical protein [Bacillota bacterium]